MPLPQDRPTYLDERARSIAAELLRRHTSALALYEPLPYQAGFHASRARQRLIWGANRIGKSLCSFAEVARAVLNCDPYEKYPATGTCYIVGKDEKHIAQVFYPKFFRAGAFNNFKIIRNELTGAWQTFHNYDPADMARVKEAKKHPPLIPPRFIKEIAWRDKKANVMSKVSLTTGWDLRFFSSKAKPPVGAEIDIAVFDEEIIDESWFGEILMRLFDRKGRFMWSATPQRGTMTFVELHERALKEQELPPEERTIEEFWAKLEHNIHFSAKDKEELRKQHVRDIDVKIRIEGELDFYSRIIFPEFNEEDHCVAWFPIPDNWTRYVAIDPGYHICAALFIAVPPPTEGDFAYAYDELYISNCHADLFGQMMGQKCQGQNFEAFIIDMRGAQVHDTASGQKILDQYSNALRKYKATCRRTGDGFTSGSDNPKAGVQEMRSWLLHRDGGQKPKLRIFQDKCRNFIYELRRYPYKTLETKDGRIVTDEPESRGRVHLMAAWRYLAMDKPVWRPPPKEGQFNQAKLLLDFLKQIKDKERRAGGNSGSYINLGPGKSIA